MGETCTIQTIKSLAKLDCVHQQYTPDQSRILRSAEDIVVHLPAYGEKHQRNAPEAVGPEVRLRFRV